MIDEGIVQAQLLRIRLRHWRMQLTGAVLLTLIVGWVFNAFAPDRRMWIWVALACLICFIQAAMCARLQRAPHDASLSKRWWNFTYVLAVGIGILWSSLALLMPAQDTRLQLLAAFTSAMVVLASSSASNTTGLLLSVVIPAMVVIPATLAWHAGIPVGGLVSVVLLVMILQHGVSLQRAMRDASRLRHRAETLSEELRIEQEKAREVMRQQVMLEERQRMMRDLHDGLGSTLVSALVALERGSVSHEDLQKVLRDCVDDARMVVDSLEPIGNDLVVLLATIRHRLEYRLQSSGLKVHWEVQDLPSLPWLGPSQGLQVMRIVQETLTNVLKHSRAGSVRIATRHNLTPDRGEQVVIVIEDDGVGFDPRSRASGRGLNHLGSRAQALGATVSIESQPRSGTRMTLTLPVRQTGATRAQ